MNKKVILITLFFLAFNLNYAQNSIFIENVPEKDSFNQTDFHLFKNDSLIYSKCNLKDKENILWNLTNGNYQLKYNTIFGIETLNFSFNGNSEHKNIILYTEKLSEEKFNETESVLENLKNNEKITIEYHLGSCFNSIHQSITLIKKNNKYFRLLSEGRLKKINKKYIENIIKYEKTLRNINTEDNLGEVITAVTCSELITFKREEEILFFKSIFCGEWSKSSEIQKWLK